MTISFDFFGCLSLLSESDAAALLAFAACGA